MKNFVFKMVAFLVALVGLAMAFEAGAVDLGAGVSTAAMIGAISDDYYRFVYEKIRELVARTNPGTTFEDWQIQEGYFRSESVLRNNRSSIIFPVTVDDASAQIDPQAQLLQRTDTFIVVEHGVLFGYRQLSLGGKTQLFSFPSQRLAAVTGADPDDLKLLYGGKLNIVSGRKNVRENLDMMSFLKAPEFNQQSMSAGGVDSGGQVLFNDLVFDGGTPLDALRRTYPQIQLNGSDKTQIFVDYPTRTGISVQATTANTEVIAVYYAKGFYLRGINVNQ